MNLVFMNTLEKQLGDERVKSAQVSISEERGVWYVFWSEMLDDGQTVRDCLFEGFGWEEMLDSFRRLAQTKLNDGYIPLVRDAWEEVTMSNHAQRQSLLKYYSAGHANEELYKELRQWRKDRALQEGKSLFIVATNAMLGMTAAFIPHTPEELKQIPGWSSRRLEQYADDVLAITGRFARETVFPLDWVASQIDIVDFIRWQGQETELREQSVQSRQRRKDQALVLIREGRELTALQKKLAMHRKDVLELIEQLDQEGHDVTSLVDSELNSVPEDRLAAAWHSFEQEGDRYLKPVFNKVYPGDSLSGQELIRAYEWLRLLRLKFRRERLHGEQPHLTNV